MTGAEGGPSRVSMLGACALGACIGLAVGGAYLAGGVARAVGGEASEGVAAASPAPRAFLRGFIHTPLPAPEPMPAATAALRWIRAPAAELECLTQAVYYESRGEEVRGRQAVAQVVLNRVRGPRFPKSVCGVVFQRAAGACAFSFVCDGQTRHPLEGAAWRDARRVARAALAGFVMQEVGTATDFRGGAGAPSGLLRVAQIGAHTFYGPGRRVDLPPPASAPTPPPTMPGAQPATAPIAPRTVGAASAPAA